MTVSCGDTGMYSFGGVTWDHRNQTSTSLAAPKVVLTPVGNVKDEEVTTAE
jgi:hypothetical protein